MSFEGYYEGLCEDGHLHNWDCYDDAPSACTSIVNGADKAPCGKSFVWWNLIDQTNDSGDEFKAKLEVKTESTHKVCPTCNHVEVIAETTYNIPENVGHKSKPTNYSDRYSAYIDTVRPE